ncbi:tryptophan transporter [Pontibacillus litoralis]|uniref:Tryptophan transporter n=1 Tax=Pontibacillus litoralis JSM 072002 TaxID=1385512 RepID=A0A0A5G2E8_9BACI|nr:tryptophan transporter [Pontibacillus litoralis]KGX85265.1 tryptophan transporter [Pontibacillus litoralis JSM 072002]
MNKQFDTRVLVMLSLLIGIGAVLHIFAPPILFGMKPDMLLVMMFLGILLFPQLPYVILLGFLTAGISALTTSVPGGQMANMVDKPITACLFFGLLIVFQKVIRPVKLAPVITAIGTIISGAIFLYVAVIIIGLVEGSFTALFLAVVLPAAVLNTVAMIIMYPIIARIFARSRISSITTKAS